MIIREAQLKTASSSYYCLVKYCTVQGCYLWTVGFRYVSAICCRCAMGLTSCKYTRTIWEWPWASFMVVFRPLYLATNLSIVPLTSWTLPYLGECLLSLGRYLKKCQTVLMCSSVVPLAVKYSGKEDIIKEFPRSFPTFWTVRLTSLELCSLRLPWEGSRVKILRSNGIL